jgi:RNA polymerase sigma factor (sigma-70 family)
MGRESLSRVMEHLRTVLDKQDAPQKSDANLLRAYVRNRDEAAFASLVRRHGPMVHGVCQRVLHNHEDAQDAFQATFLILIRKAASLRSPALLANWLYGVAYRTAFEARKSKSIRRTREAAMAPKAESSETLTEDLRALLDLELERLPDKYRAVIVMCELEGKTRKEAAQQLGWPEGTVAGRLSRGRKLLAKRLTKYGIALSAASLAEQLAEAAITSVATTALLIQTVEAATSSWRRQAAGRVFSVQAVGLAEGVMKSMLWTKLKSGAGQAVIVLAVAGIGVVVATPYLAPAEARQQVGVESGDQNTSKAASQTNLSHFDEKLITAERIVGEWQQVVSLKKPDDTLLVMTFRKSGICRLDALDRTSRKQVQGPEVHLPGVGLWKIDGPDLVITWENWNQGTHRPVAQLDRYKIERSTDKELFYRATVPGRAIEDFPLAKWVRFEGWWMATLSRKVGP